MEDLVGPMIPNSCPASLLSEWGGHARQCNRLHEAAAIHFSGRSDAGFVTAVVLGSAGGLSNFLLGAVGAEYGGVLSGSQVALCLGLMGGTVLVPQ